jgi:hypothetical protein
MLIPRWVEDPLSVGSRDAQLSWIRGPIAIRFVWLRALVQIRVQINLGHPSWKVETCKMLILRRKEVAQSAVPCFRSASCTSSAFGPPVLQLFTILCDCLTYLALLAVIVSLGHELSEPVGED